MAEKNEGKPKKVEHAPHNKNIILIIFAAVIIVAFVIGSQSVIGGLKFFFQDIGKEIIENEDGTISIPTDAQITQNENNNNTYVGKVLNEKLQLGRQDEFNQRLQFIMNYQQLDPTFKYQLARQAFDDSINKIIGMYKAKKMNIKISKTTLSQEIGKRYFSVDGEVDYSQMKDKEDQINTLTKGVMRDLMYERFQFDYFDGLPVSKREIEMEYKLENSKIKIKYIVLENSEVDINKLQEYYTANTENYKLYKLTRLVFKDKKAAEEALRDVQTTSSSEEFTELGNTLKEDDKITNIIFDSEYSLLSDFGSEEMQTAVKETYSGSVSATIVDGSFGPEIFRVEDVRTGSFGEPNVQSQIKLDYLADNQDTIDSENRTKAQDIYNYGKTNGLDFISMVYPVKVEEPETAIQFMGYSFPNINPDTTDDLMFMVKAFNAEEGAILEPYKYSDGYMIVQIKEKQTVGADKIDDLYDSLVKRYSDEKKSDLERDFYREERKNFKIVDNFQYVFKPQDFVSRDVPQ